VETPFPAACAAQYAPRRLLASGGFGTVWLATQKSVGRPVVVKLLHREILGNEEQVRRFSAEARIASMLRHPGIVEALDYGTDDGTPWIVYEFIEGPSLRTRLAEGPLPWTEAQTIGIQMAAALEVAHQRLVLHRDIKPENILDAGNGVYKLTDFGIARWSESGVETSHGMLLGTPGYMSPQQVKGMGAAIESDLYALGLVLYELSTGILPHWDQNVTLLFQKRLNEPVDPPSHRFDGIPRAFDRVLLKLLEARREDRYHSAGELRADLEAVGVVRGSAFSRGTRVIPGGSSARGVPGAAQVTALIPDSSPVRPAFWMVMLVVVVGILASIAGYHRSFPPPPIPTVILPAPPVLEEGERARMSSLRVAVESALLKGDPEEVIEAGLPYLLALNEAREAAPAELRPDQVMLTGLIAAWKKTTDQLGMACDRLDDRSKNLGQLLPRGTSGRRHRSDYLQGVHGPLGQKRLATLKIRSRESADFGTALMPQVYAAGYLPEVLEMLKISLGLYDLCRALGSLPAFELLRRTMNRPGDPGLRWADHFLASEIADHIGDPRTRLKEALAARDAFIASPGLAPDPPGVNRWNAWIEVTQLLASALVGHKNFEEACRIRRDGIAVIPASVKTDPVILRRIESMQGRNARECSPPTESKGNG